MCWNGFYSEFPLIISSRIARKGKNFLMLRDEKLHRHFFAARPAVEFLVCNKIWNWSGRKQGKLHVIIVISG
jgi:hypothetical protein